MRREVHKANDRRHRIKFLWLPLTIRGLMRWLEWAEWEEEYIAGRGSGYWSPFRWLDVEENGEARRA